MSDKNNIVKDVCKELGVNQKELAELIGVNEDTVSNWATGKTQTPKWLLRMLDLIKIEKKYLDIKRSINNLFS